VLQTVLIPSNHACNRIGSNYNVQRDRRQFFLCKKSPGTGPGTDAIISVRAAVAARVISPRHTLSVILSPTHLRCTAAKRVARAANANPISENNFSRGRILARLFKTSDLTDSCCGTPRLHHSSSLPSPTFILYPFCRPTLVLLLSCRPIFSVPPLNRARFSQ